MYSAAKHVFVSKEYYGFFARFAGGDLVGVVLDFLFCCIGDLMGDFDGAARLIGVARSLFDLSSEFLPKPLLVDGTS